MKIVDDVTSKLVDVDGGWYLRLACPTMTEQVPEQPFLWYRMSPTGWMVVRKGDVDGLETDYQELLKGTAQ